MEKEQLALYVEGLRGEATDFMLEWKDCFIIAYSTKDKKEYDIPLELAVSIMLEYLYKKMSTKSDCQ